MATHKTQSTLVVEHLAKSYPTAGEPLQVLSDVSLSLSAGDSLAIVGPSGCGKSTLLQILGTLDVPDHGSVRIDGQDPFALNENQLAGFRNQHVGFIFQDHHLLPQLTVLENILVPALAQGSPRPERFQHAQQLLESVGLADRRGHLPSELSGGERERVAIARALLMRPSLVLADEPTGNLDRRTADSVSELLLDLPTRHGVILVVVTHSHTLASALQQRRELSDGKLKEC
ncbi:Lipoprotein-releasing system ATP-binding protein LolD [Novipirellula galeiformis]|uniref:Lipoprotein-releasing system ATP-binding protein LolD n=1 Tax=Novipirellula galeiformis TaxID=2528004 RepID=A0A5C6BYL2_9BACT|nr:ABC transporter ATP-binding protein [Novipirellula galeiformis]TWU17420.1 Lipoprotein-releasing system ATP-binding protein LolD [Novipirellula galeiformis]